MGQSITTALWKATERAQLQRFLYKNEGKDIHLGELTYTISQGFIEEPNDMAKVELVQKSTGTCFWVRLGLIDPEYNNYSALDQASRLDLVSELAIEI